MTLARAATDIGSGKNAPGRSSLHRSFPAPAPASRIFTACHSTQLLVIQHLRRHLRRSAAREFLVWHPLGNNPAVDRFMAAVVAQAGFDGVLDIRDFQSAKPRTQGALAWWFEAARRLRDDAAAVRSWMAANGIDDGRVELWADDPIHFNVMFLRGMLKQARHVKIPHCFNHEDAMVADWKGDIEAKWASASWSRRLLLLPWQRWASAVDMRMERVVYDSAYTFALPSPWSANSIDVSTLIAMDAFTATYQDLPGAMRAEVEDILAPIRDGARPLVLLLLFGLGTDDESRTIYQRAIARIFSEHGSELAGCSLVVKWHPGATGQQEPLLTDWLRANIPAHVHEIRHPLNLEFMLPQLQPDYVVAGLCGSLPIVRELRAGRPIMIAEWLDLYLRDRPQERHWVMQFLQGIEVW